MLAVSLAAHVCWLVSLAAHVCWLFSCYVGSKWYILIYMFLLSVVEAFTEAKVKFALCGGQALALHGAVRGTIDIDFVLGLSLKNLEAAERVLVDGLGLVSRIPVQAKDIVQFRQEYIEKRNLIAWSFVSPTRPSEIIDIIITEDLSDFSIVYVKAWNKKIPLVSINDLIRMKKISARPQDLADIEALKILKTRKK
jgi:hypothetical protein